MKKQVLSKEKNSYKSSEIEAKWQKVWLEQGLYKTPKPKNKKKYILDMFPYPSGATMHVGHLEGYVGTDILSRYFRMKGYSVLHPMGWDAFGLPAENYAIKTNIHPRDSTDENVKTFKRQLDSTGLSYDWEREINTSGPKYHKWNQWLFILLFKKGLAYKKKANVNWCPSCETVLANEQVIEGKCERCETKVEKIMLSQWFFKITAYADRLLSGLEHINWLDEVKTQQVNWIGKKQGIEITYEVEGTAEKIAVFTTRPDTNFGATFIVLAPEHPLIVSLPNSKFKIPSSKFEEIKNYVDKAKNKSEQERLSEGKEKTGVFTGFYAINQLTGRKMPIWISDYVLSGFGTGAVVGVPGHDKRDFKFAREFDLEIIRVVAGKDGDASDIIRDDQVQEDEGVMINSGFLNGMDIHLATEKMMDYLEDKGYGKRVATYHLRDWLISRQRYWGTPIPMIYCQNCADAKRSWFDTLEAKKIRSTKSEIRNKSQISNSNDKNTFEFRNSDFENSAAAGWYPVEDKDLPLLLPKDVDFKPTGQSPIARSKSFQEKVFCPRCGAKARREVDTMDGYVDSSWYFMRFADPKNDRVFAGRDALLQWLPVDVYIGGGHVVQHLLFARFFWKVLLEEGLIDKSLGDEPFLKLRAPGWILGPDSRKMSKRWGNVITPDDITPKYGADTLRMYEMFMGPFEFSKPWSLSGVEGMRRFVNKIWVLFHDTISSNLSTNEQDKEVDILINSLVKKVGEDVENLRFNTAIASMMDSYNKLIKFRRESKRISWNKVWEQFLLVLAPFAPHITEELYQKLQAASRKYRSIHLQAWPSYDPDLLKADVAIIIVQINGKLRDTIKVSVDDVSEKYVEEKAKGLEKVQKSLKGKTIHKVIYVPAKIINFVVT